MVKTLNPLVWRLRYKRLKLRLPQAMKKSEQHAKKSAIKSLFYIFLILIIHTFAMVQFEGFTIGDSLWLTLTSITTVGYGDISAATGLGRLSTVLILYFGGIFVFAKMAGDFIDYRSLRREAIKNGNWSWHNMNDHIIIIGSKTDSIQHLVRLISECRREPETAMKEIVLISEKISKDQSSGVSGILQDSNVNYVKGHGNVPAVLEKAAIGNAAIVIILAWKDEEPFSDGHAFDVISRVRSKNSTAKIVAECVDDDNRKRLENAGATLVMRPVRAYPEMIIGGLLNPGSTIILENLFTAAGERIVRSERLLSGIWSVIVSDYLENDSGTPIAYRDANTGEIVTAPSGTRKITADAIYLLGA
jgi:voltage-gated potassium channel